RISAKLRLAYLKSLFSQPIKKLDTVSTGTVANAITDSANTIQLSISDKLHHLFYGIALTISAYSIAFRYSWSITLVASSSLLFVVVLQGILMPFLVKKQLKVQ